MTRNNSDFVFSEALFNADNLRSRLMIRNVLRHLRIVYLDMYYSVSDGSSNAEHIALKVGKL
jgi:hypothetical protein